MRSGIIIDIVRFEILIYVGPEDIAEGKNVVIREKHVYEIMELGLGPQDVIHIN